MWSTINKQLIPLKLYYFYFCGGLACIVPYMPMFASQFGFRTGEIGVIYGILPFVGLLSKPVVGILADKLNAHRLVLLIALVVQGVFTFVVYYLPPMPIEQTYMQLNCNKDAASLEMGINSSAIFCGGQKARISCGFKELDYVYSALNITGLETMPMPMEFLVETTAQGAKTGGLGVQIPVNLSYLGQSRSNCESPISSNCSATICQDPNAPVDFVRFTFQFWLFLIVMTISRVGYTASYTMGDSVAFDIIGQQKQPVNYGTQRVFGSFGWALAAVIVGFLMDQFTESRGPTDFAPAFYGFVALLACAVITAWFLKPSENIHTTQLLKNVGRLFADKEFAVFSVGTFLVGVLTGLLYTYLFIYMDELHAPKLLMGLSQLAECFGEAPFMFLSSWLISRMGHHGAMTFALFSFSIRFIFYSWLGTNLWWILILELFHGPGFGLFYANMATFAHNVAPSGAEATMQGVLGGIYDGFGIALGGLIGGTIYQRFGGRIAWRSFGIGAAVAAVLYLGVTLFFHRRKKRLSRKELDLNGSHLEDVPPSGYETPIPPDTPSEKERLTT